MIVKVTLNYVCMLANDYHKDGKFTSKVKLGFPEHFANLEFWINDENLYKKIRKSGQVVLNVNLETCKCYIADFIS